MIRAARLAALGTLLLAVAPGAASAAPAIHAHRGGPFVAGKAAYPEETMPAFRAAARAGFVLELDTRVTRDGVVALHDATLDRTTTCAGPAAELTLAQIAKCPSDIVGSPGSTLGSRPKAGGAAPPRLATVLRLAKRTKARVNVELNDYNEAAAGRVVDVIADAGLPRRRVIIQSFSPQMLAVAKRRLPRVERASLALKAFNEQALGIARTADSDWISPEWPVDRAYVRRANRAGLKVVPFTLNRASDVRAAARAKVDALITDDPTMARRTLRRMARRARD